MVTERIQLGAYEVITKTKVFPRAFWAVMVTGSKVLLEMDGPGGDPVVQWVEAAVLEQAMKKGQVRLVEGVGDFF